MVRVCTGTTEKLLLVTVHPKKQHLVANHVTLSGAAQRMGSLM